MIFRRRLIPVVVAMSLGLLGTVQGTATVSAAPAPPVAGSAQPPAPGSLAARHQASLVEAWSGAPSTATPTTQSAVSSPPNVFVSNDQPRRYGAPAIAKDPTNPAHIAIAYSLRFDFQHRFQNSCILALSDDAGQHWTRRDMVGPQGLYPAPPGYVACGRPSVAFGPNGILYYFPHVIHPIFGEFRQGEFVMVSRDGGATFTHPRPIDPAQEARSAEAAGAGDEQLQVAVDQHTGRVQVAWTRYTHEFCCGSTILTAYSDDHARTFSTPVAHNDPTTNPGEFPAIAVGSDSAVYLDWLDEPPVAQNSVGTTPFRIAFSVSHDGGQSYGPKVILATVSNGCQDSSCFNDNDFTAVPFVQNAAGGPPGLVVVAWSGSENLNVGSVPSHPGPVRIRVLRSTDGGATFSVPQVVGVPDGRQSDRQHHPWLSFSPQGRLDIAYYDSTPDVTLEDTYLTSSLDLGASFGSAVRISSQSSDAKNLYLFNDNYSIGRMVASTDGAAHVTWTDSRRGTLADHHTDVMFAREPRP